MREVEQLPEPPPEPQPALTSALFLTTQDALRMAEIHISLRVCTCPVCRGRRRSGR